MINLLPPESKDEIMYGRKNKALINWIIAALLVLVSVVAIIAIGQIYIKSNVNNLNKTAESTKEFIATQQLEEKQKEIEEFSSNLNTVTKLMEDQLLFSKIITSLGSVLPDKVTVSNVNFQASDNTLKLQLIGIDEQAVTQGFINLSSGTNALFSSADLEGVDCSEEDQCLGSVTVLLNKDSEFYFLNDVKSQLESENE